jgi:hypothetical protein
MDDTEKLNLIVKYLSERSERIAAGMERRRKLDQANYLDKTILDVQLNEAMLINFIIKDIIDNPELYEEGLKVEEE